MKIKTKEVIISGKFYKNKSNGAIEVQVIYTDRKKTTYRYISGTLLGQSNTLTTQAFRSLYERIGD